MHTPVKDCLPSCGCRATTARDAVTTTARFIGLDPEHATALVSLLREYGWTLVRDA